MAGKSPLRQLADIISASVDRVEARYAEAGLDFPSLDEPFDPSSKTEAVLLEPQVLIDTQLIVAACQHLGRVVGLPGKTVVTDSLAHCLSSCLRVVVDGDVVEILRPAGRQGMHVKDVSAKNQTDPAKLGRMMRYLANNHIFKEVSPDVFANNRLSSVLDSGKDFGSFTPKHIVEKHMGTVGIGALVTMVTDEGMKGSALVPELLLDPKTSFDFEPFTSPFSKGMGTDLRLFEYFDRPENKDRHMRFSIGLNSTIKWEPDDAVIRGFDWGSLPTNGPIVDVGGGVGTASLIIAKAFPEAKLIVQDRPGTIEDAKVYCADSDAYKEGRIELQVHDFLTPQPVKNASAFLCRFITHDWSDVYVKKILTHLRKAATPDTKLITIDSVIPYTCKASINDEIPGAALPPVPSPLLPSLGEVTNLAFQVDYMMHVYFNGQERTLGHFVSLAKECGWKIVEFYHVKGSVFGQTVAVPI